MNYEIQSRSDFLTGTYLVARIPENELDQNALNTIQADCPDFILPFHYKNADGQIEFVYKVGTLCKLHYFSGDLTPREYAKLWQSLLKPLLKCGDWFMNPCSFLIKSEYLYYDKNKKAVRYVYIPTAYGCSGHDAFYEMAVEVSKMMMVSDAVLENKALRAIIKDFNPVEFLQMINDHVAEDSEVINAASADTGYEKREIKQEIKAEILEEDKNEAAYSPNMEVLEVNESPAALKDTAEDIIIDIPSQQRKKEKEFGGYRFFGSRSKRRRAFINSSPDKAAFSNGSEQENVGRRDSLPIVNRQPDMIDITQNVPVISNGPGLRFVGRANLPPSIQVLIAEGEIFTIGRFDANIGKKQSSFEFDKKTKAVSRRHAVIEKSANEYRIIDLSSSAGTYVNDKKVPPNTPINLETGCRVSFGNSGADYVWEVN